MLAQLRKTTVFSRSFGSRLPSNGLRLRSSHAADSSTIETLKALQSRAIWLSSYMVHNANNIRPKRDGLKVGGHQSSSTSMVSILTALYFHALRQKDRVAVKPHASPIFHAIQYLLGNETKESLINFRGLGGAQSYPSRTKDKVDVDFSTGSVGLGASITSFAAYAQDWLRHKNFIPKLTEDGPARMISLIGDAELDEGNIYESLMESWKHNMKENWWIIDYNRQSLDKVCENASFRQIDKMFRANGWEVIIVKYGKKLMKAFDGVGGKAVKKWFNDCDNETYAALVFRGGAAFRSQMKSDIGSLEGVSTFLGGLSDDQLYEVMTDLGGHCIETLLEAFHKASHNGGHRTCFICYTNKGFGLPLAGHRDNHGLFMNGKQVEVLQEKMKVPVGQEWDPFVGIPGHLTSSVQKLIENCPFRYGVGKGYRDYASDAEVFSIPDSFYEEKGTNCNTQTVFGQIMLAIAKSKDKFADRVMTMAPDVATSTNLTGFLNLRGVFSLGEREDSSKKLQMMSMCKWQLSPQGQHVELGIAESNLFLMLSAAGLSANLFGQRIFPVGTLYDPFIARGLDSLNYGCYQDSRFLLAATPSGISLSPEGGAHQSINTPLIAMGQPGLTYFEPAFADELQILVSWAFRHMQLPAGQGGAVYLRLSTRNLDQVPREMTPELRESITKGAYFHDAHGLPSNTTKLVVAFVGVLHPEARQACDELRALIGEDSVSLMQITSPSVLYSGFQKYQGSSYISSLFADLPSSAKIVTVMDGHPSALTWLGSVRGNQVRSLGVTAFGQSGDLPDLYSYYGIDKNSILSACKDVLQI